MLVEHFSGILGYPGYLESNVQITYQIIDSFISKYLRILIIIPYQWHYIMIDESPKIFHSVTLSHHQLSTNAAVCGLCARCTRSSRLHEGRASSQRGEGRSR